VSADILVRLSAYKDSALVSQCREQTRGVNSVQSEKKKR